ncbi:MAG TPA: hypothetical protein DCM21_10460 [Butyrivibrio sp.]|nr:hypothetical protein [Butyrivibrio sp.]
MNDKKKFEPRRFRIYKLSTFDALTDEERSYHMLYKEAKKEKVLAKKTRDKCIASYKGVRKIDRNRLYLYDYDDKCKIIEGSERENIDKQVALAESEIARMATDFSEPNPLVMEIVYLKTSKLNEVLHQIIERGLDIDGQHYIFYTSTTNQMKRGESILLKEDFCKEHEQEIMLGLTDDVVNAKGGCNIGKRLAYNGLLLSTSFIPNDYQLTLDDCLIVPDFETIINEKVECIDHNNNSITNISVRNKDIKIPQTDGAGMFLPGVLPYSCQIRCGHIKGCVFPLDFRKFLQLDEVEGVKPSAIVSDPWGKKHDVIKENIKIILTASQVKMWKYYDSWEELKEAYNAHNKKIAINNFAEESKGWEKTGYQFNQTLDSNKLTDEKIKDLCADTLDYLNEMKTDANKIAEILSEPNLSNSIKAYPELIQDKYIQKKMENKFRSERREACGNKLILKDSLYAYICPDLFAFCEWLFCGIENPKGIIPREQVYCSFYNEEPYNKYEVVDCLRSPHLYMEHGIRKLVKDEVLERCKEWFVGDDLVVSSHDLLCRILQFDVDGDHALVTPNKTMIECVPTDKHILYYIGFDADKPQITKEAIYKALVASMDNSNIGDISNAMTKNYNNEEIDDEFNKVMCCYNNLTIDFPKTQQNICLGKYEDKFKHLINEQPPYFFQYAKNKKRDNCKPLSDSNCDRICAYIRKSTSNKRYTWKTDKPFKVGVLFDESIKVDITDEAYRRLEQLMFDLKRREQSLTFRINNEIEQLDKSDAMREKISKYDVFYTMCDKMILCIFDGDRKRATAYLTDFEYLQRENCDSGKNILWNCYGDIILENIKANVGNPAGITERKPHYKKKGSGKKNREVNEIGKSVIEKINKDIEEVSTVTIYKDELEWIDNLPYRKNCSNDRELLFILMVQQKRSKSGKVWVYANKRTALTCNGLDKMIGDGVCVAKKGIKRLENMGAIFIIVHGKDMEIIVNCPDFDKTKNAYKIESKQRNPIIPFYENNKERVITECPYCHNKYIKVGNMKTCQNATCREQLIMDRKLGYK